MFRYSYWLTAFALTALLSSCSEANQPGEGQGTAESAKPARAENVLDFMPHDTQVLVYANLEKIRNTPVGREFQTEFDKELEDEDEEYREFIEFTGLDPERDIHELWFGGQPVPEEDMAGGAIVRGEFDEERIVDYIEKKEPGKISRHTYRGHTVYDLEDDADLTFLSGNLAAVGDEAWLRSIIDHVEDGGESVLDNSVMQSHIQQVQDKEHVWGVMELSEFSDAWARELRKSSAFKGTETIEKMRSIVFYSHFDEKTDLFLKGSFSTQDEAETVAEMFNGFKAMAKLMMSDDREAVDMLNQIKIRTDGPVVEITSQVDKSFWDKMREKRGRFSRGGVELL